MRKLAWLASVAAALVIIGCSDDREDGTSSGTTTTPAVCGNAVCEAQESASGCPSDCGCGNGTVDTGEACDGSDLGDATCQSEGMGSGTLACAPDCTLDLSGCDGGPSCGDGILDAGEECDGAELGDKTCATEGGDAGTLACNPNCTLDISACCTDACDTSGASQCAGDVVETCNPTASGCLEWVAATDCASLGQICTVAGGEASCAPSCTDQCTAAGDTQCNGDVVETCAAGPDGCLDWTPGTDCAATNEACDATGGTAVCVATCVDQCPATGDAQCSGNVLQLCALDADGCLDWLTDTDCAASSQICDTSTGMPACVTPCSDQCGPEGVESCDGTVTQTCELAGSGCLDWAAGTDCALTSQICDASSGTAECITPCTDECTTAGEQSCGGTVVLTCTLAPSGCLELEPGTDCAATGQICEESSGTATCVTPCTNECPVPGVESCDGSDIQMCIVGPDGCFDYQLIDSCSATQVCVEDGFGDATCQPLPGGGEDCSNPVQIQAGPNLVSWTATNADYLTVKPDCVTVGELEGPDVVLSYMAPFDALVTLTFDNKPINNRWVAIPSSGPCGTPVPELACISDWAPPSMAGTFPAVGGQTYFIYVRDTTSGTLALSNPMSVQVSEADCAPSPPVTVSNFLPADGSTTTTLSPTLTVNFNGPLNTGTGVITLVGATTNLAFNLSTNPSQVTFSANKQTMTIEPGPLPSGETITVSWTGLVSECNKPITPPPSWSFTVVTAPCGPGQAGMVGAATTAVPTGIGTLTENFAAADDDPAGYAYVGGLTTLFRFHKSGGGVVENVHTLAGLTGTHLGYTMAIAGQSIFTVESKTTGTNGHLWRISTTGGTTWNVEDFATFPQVPADDFRGSAVHDGRVFLLTHEGTSGVLTQVWSVDAFDPVVPTTAVLEASIPGELNCSGLAVDAVNFYLACGTSTRLVRVPRTTPTLTTLLTAAWPLNTTVNTVHAKDTTADGLADYLYFKGGTREVFFVCGPGGATPYSDQLVNFGTTTTTNYGLGFDAVANQLWAHHDTTKDFVLIQ